jgi:hypothetical protein
MIASRDLRRQASSRKRSKGIRRRFESCSGSATRAPPTAGHLGSRRGLPSGRSLARPRLALAGRCRPRRRRRGRRWRLLGRRGRGRTGRGLGRLWTLLLRRGSTEERRLAVCRHRLAEEELGQGHGGDGDDERDGGGDQRDLESESSTSVYASRSPGCRPRAVLIVRPLVDGGLHPPGRGSTPGCPKPRHVLSGTTQQLAHDRDDHRCHRRREGGARWPEPGCDQRRRRGGDARNPHCLNREPVTGVCAGRSGHGQGAATRARQLVRSWDGRKATRGRARRKAYGLARSGRPTGGLDRVLQSGGGAGLLRRGRTGPFPVAVTPLPSESCCEPLPLIRSGGRGRAASARGVVHRGEQ